ncbi:MAG: hypothetical protein JWQ87_976, partial [Candidatus Sulfotelmatobacter sp.]|nr:hypothetical protein [Candidatus Sulfotelmatobacter sp.]
MNNGIVLRCDDYLAALPGFEIRKYDPDKFRYSACKVVLNRPMSWVGVRGRHQETIVFFRLKLILPEGECLSGRSEFWHSRGPLMAAIHPSQLVANSYAAWKAKWNGVPPAYAPKLNPIED